MSKSEVLKNEAAVLLAGALEQAANMAEFDWAQAADQIVEKILAAAEAKRLEDRTVLPGWPEETGEGTNERSRKAGR